MLEIILGARLEHRPAAKGLLHATGRAGRAGPPSDATSPEADGPHARDGGPGPSASRPTTGAGTRALMKVMTIHHK